MPGILRAQRRAPTSPISRRARCWTATTSCVNGQKVWTSMAPRGRLVLPAGAHRSRPRPSTRASSFLLVDMKTPGITVRPLRQITGEAEFNEIVLRQRARAEGQPGRQAQRGLGRGHHHARLRARPAHLHPPHLAAQRAAPAGQAHPEPAARDTDPVVRQKIAELWIGEQALQLNGYRSLTKILRGGQPGPEGSTSKLFWSQLDQELAQAATEVIGPYSQIARGLGVGARRRPVAVLRAAGARQRHPRRHHRDPQQHPGRARARPAQGLRRHTTPWLTCSTR